MSGGHLRRYGSESAKHLSWWWQLDAKTRREFAIKGKKTPGMVKRNVSLPFCRVPPMGRRFAVVRDPEDVTCWACLRAMARRACTEEGLKDRIVKCYVKAGRVK